MQKPTSIDIPLHDIKPLVEVPDYSLYILIASVAVLLALAIGVIFFVRYMLNRKKENMRIEEFKNLENIDFSDAKQAAYDISHYGLFFRDDSPRHFEAYQNLVLRLGQYKYKKDVDKTLDNETKGYYDIYVGMIDV